MRREKAECKKEEGIDRMKEREVKIDGCEGRREEEGGKKGRRKNGERNGYRGDEISRWLGREGTASEFSQSDVRERE